jgi:hypothetical protein
LEWKGVSRHMARPYAEPSLASLHQSEQWYYSLTCTFLTTAVSRTIRRTFFLDCSLSRLL